MKTSSLATALAVALLLPASSYAQSVLTGIGNWSNVDPGSVYTTNATSGTGAGNKNVATPGAGVESVVLSLGGAATRNADAIADTFNLVLRSTQTFTLGEQAAVTIPTFLFGSLNFLNNLGPPNTNLGISGVTAEVVVLDNLLNPTGLSVTRVFNGAAQTGNVAVNTFNYANTTLAAGNYTTRATLTLTGDAVLASAVTSAVSSDFISTLRSGLATSLGTYRLGLGSSRDAVTAPAGRTEFGVDGSGVGGNRIKVGLLETGQPYAHTALPAARVTVLTGPTAGDWVREHALATAGIIAAGAALLDPSDAGIAPGAQIVSAPVVSYATNLAALDALIGDGVRIVNMSATDGGEAGFTTSVNQRVNANPTLSFVKSSGNSEPTGVNSITSPGMAHNILTVGALNRDFSRRADFSSYSHGVLPLKPDLVAPGEYINAPLALDINGDATVNDFNRHFLGEGYHRPLGPTTGEISGTSFSAPHVAGAVALLHDYRAKNPGVVDADSIDHRVMKAVLLDTAKTTGITHQDGATAWTQTKTGSAAAQNLKVTRSLDAELGAGALETRAALALFAAGEIRAADNNGAQNFIIDATEANGLIAPRKWDLETVQGLSLGMGVGTVDYLLGEIVGAPFRCTLTWDYDTTLNLLPKIELRFFSEGSDDGNLPGFDPLNPNADFLMAETIGEGENVKLLDFTVPDLGPRENLGFYVEVTNNELGVAAKYGIAISVPEPSSLLLVVFGNVLLITVRRRR